MACRAQTPRRDFPRDSYHLNPKVTQKFIAALWEHELFLCPTSAGRGITEMSFPGGWEIQRVHGELPLQWLVGTKPTACAACLWGRPGIQTLQPELGQIPMPQISFGEVSFLGYSCLTSPCGVQESFVDLKETNLKPTANELVMPACQESEGEPPLSLGCSQGSCG